MNLVQKMTLNTRLIALVALSGVLLIGLGMMGLHSMSTAGNGIGEAYRDELIPSGQLTRIINLLQENRAELLAVMQHDPASPLSKRHNHTIEFHLERVQRDAQAIDAIWQDYRQANLTPEERTLADEFASARSLFAKNGLQPTIEAIRAEHYDKASALLFDAVRPAFKSVSRAAEALIAHKLKIAEQTYKDTETHFRFTRNVAIGLMVLGIGLQLALAFLTIPSISRGVGGLQRATHQLAAGDLTVRVDYKGKDELGQVAASFNRMGDQFENIIREVAQSTEQLAAAAEQNSAITECTSTDLREQNSNTDQLATAMNEMAATIQEVARHAANAAKAAVEADHEATNGTQVVSQSIDDIKSLADEVERATGVIHALETDTEKVGSVLDVIRGIAEQTNLLALNAAIEAARAGDQGRGFAVVADEVRTLASRTQESTKEIQEMIERLQSQARDAVRVMEGGRQRVEASVEQSNRAGHSLQSITQAAASISDMNTQIATAAEEQSVVAEEMNRNVVGISQVAQRTTEGAQQTAAANERLAALAAQLQGLVRQFKTHA